jgi:predicted O-methyltransferase YrrM
VDRKLEAFLDELFRFGDDNDARETERPRRMLNITPDTGRLLSILIRSSRATRILEVGTSNAYSTIWLADAARATGGRVVTLEADPGKIVLARENLRRAGCEDRVDVVPGRAAETLPTLSGPFDFVFLDADRASYLTYLELVLPRVVTGGLIVADNVTSHPDELAAYLARVKSHPSLCSVTVPVGKGEEISYKLS